MKALITDDGIDICYLPGGVLTNKKPEVDYVTPAADAVKVIDTYRPEIAFLNNRLPDGKGIDFAGYIKQRIPKIKVAMITAYDIPGDRNLALSQGIDFLLQKPFTKNKIYETPDEMIAYNNWQTVFACFSTSIFLYSQS